MSGDAITSARVEQCGEVIVSEQGCAWPECGSAFPLGDNPVTTGWRAFGVTRCKVVLCPFHSAGEHLPRVIRLNPGVFPLRVACACGWGGDICGNASHFEVLWREHIEAVGP